MNKRQEIKFQKIQARHIEDKTFRNYRIYKSKFFVQSFPGFLFESTQIIDSDISGSSFERSQWVNTEIIDSRLSETKLESSNFKNVTIRNVVFKKSLLNRSRFENVKFVNCSFDDVDFSGSSFKNTVFKDCNYSRINFAYCDLAEVLFLGEAYREMFKKRLKGEATRLGIKNIFIPIQKELEVIMTNIARMEKRQEALSGEPCAHAAHFRRFMAETGISVTDIAGKIGISSENLEAYLSQKIMRKHTHSSIRTALAQLAYQRHGYKLISVEKGDPVF